METATMETTESPKSESASAERPKALPFIKMAGGKRGLLPELDRRVPPTFRRYVEPMMGGAALYYHLWSAGRLEGCEVVLADASPFVCELFTTVRDGVESIIPLLEAHARIHGLDHYLEIRDRLGAGNLAERAADILYLSRTCWNGLLRFSKRAGRFNTPMGRYANPTICDHKRLRASSAALQDVVIVEADFETTLREHVRGTGDFVYFDPPYLPRDEEAPSEAEGSAASGGEPETQASTLPTAEETGTAREAAAIAETVLPAKKKKTKAFSAYTQADFGIADHERLAGEVRRIHALGAEVLVSQSDARAIRDLYDGFEIDEVLARRSINSVASGRGHVTELLIRGRQP